VGAPESSGSSETYEFRSEFAERTPVQGEERMRTHENKTSDQALHTGLISSKPLLKYSHESIAKTFFCKLANFKEAALRQHRFPTLHFLTMLLLYVLPEPLSDRQTYCHYLPLHP
jgi:hypothetical protein